MRDTRKRVTDDVGSTTTEQSARTGSQEPFAARMARMGRAVGNEEVQRRLSQGNASRDELLDFLGGRLRTIRSVQLRELDLEIRQREWWKKVTLTDRDRVTKPDPTRWHEAAHLYDRAADALCRGDLTAGSELVKRAIKADRRAFDRLTDLVETDQSEREFGAPAALDDVEAHQACGRCEKPEEARIADDILAVVWTIEDPPTRRRVRDPWWTEEEEEEDEAEPGGDEG